jgi:Flp pilus assembly pilin Flp
LEEKSRDRVNVEHRIARAKPVHLAVLGLASPRAEARSDRTKGGESMTKLYAYLQTRVAREEGQTMAEYGVVLAVITIATVAVFGLLSDEIEAALDRVIDVLSGAGGS